MRILGLLVENIRSYKSDIIVLPPSGIIVIYGPSGSGKTSLLMSINFALFGMATGPRSGDVFDAYKNPHGVDLLRVDSVRGKVRLLVAMGGRLYVIERIIEKQGNRYLSGTGLVEEYVIDSGGVKPIARRVFESRTEMDNYVVNLLGVHEKKSERGIATPLVYTTALYVPQFKTHEVMELGGEERTGIIERALGLEKYKLFKVNYEKVMKALKDKLKEIEIRIGEYSKRLKEKSREMLLKDKERLLVEHDRLEREKAVVEEKYKALLNKLNELKEREKDLALRKQELLRQLDTYRKIYDKLLEVEDKISRLIGIPKFDEALVNEFTSEFQAKQRQIDQERSAIEGRISAIDAELSNIENELRKLKDEILVFEKKASENKKEQELVIKALTDMEAEYRELEELVKRGVCPLCKQPITHEHGLKLIAEKFEKIRAEKARLERLRAELEKVISKLEELRKAVSSFEDKKLKLGSERNLAVKRRDEIFEESRKISELLARLNELVTTRNDLVCELAKIDVKRVQLDMVDLDKKMAETRSQIDEVNKHIVNLLEVKEKISRELGKVEEALKTVERDLREVENLVEELTKLQRDVGTLRSVNELLEHSFQAIGEVEKNVLKILVNEFRRYFYEYVSTLIPDQPVEVVVRDDFSVVQKIKIGRSTYDVSSLSGGQSIAISLAYRLALNQVVRRYSPTLRKSVLILDEPTTGFSRELVSRLRDLLKSVGGAEGQVLVVTHDETLIEAGDCKIKLSLDPVEHKTVIEYEECGLGEDYRKLVESILTGKYGIPRVEVSRSSGAFKPSVLPVSRHERCEDSDTNASNKEDCNGKAAKRGILYYMKS